MSSVDIVITDLTFPAQLEDKFCKFRPLVSVRYIDSNDQTKIVREALPGLGPRDYWECEKANKKKDDFVRHSTKPMVDMDRVDISKREILFSDLDVKKLERLEVELFDIDIKTGFEKLVQTGLTLLPPEALTFITPGLPVTLIAVKAAVEKGTGKSVNDLEKKVLNKLIGKEDGAARSIFVKTQPLTNEPNQVLTVKGPGKQGDYSMTFEIKFAA
jgi:hypothetical protein